MMILETWALSTVILYLCIAISKKELHVGSPWGEGSIYKSKSAVVWGLFYLIPLLLVLLFLITNWRQNITVTDAFTGIVLAVITVALMYKSTWGSNTYSKRNFRRALILAILGIVSFLLALSYVSR